MGVILFEGKALSFGRGDLPLIIHGEDGNGASLFSISVMANLYNLGTKLLFISGYPMARDELKEQIGSTIDAILIESEVDLAKAHTKRVIFVPAGKQELFIRLLNELPDIAERIIYFKNYDLFDASVFDAVRKYPACVMQGDLNKVPNLANYIGTNWATKIYFSQPPELFDDKVPQLPKYNGFLRQDSKSGTVSLGM